MKHGAHASLALRAAYLLFVVGLAGAPAPSMGKPPRAEAQSRSMPDGKLWTSTNLNVDIPSSYCFDDQFSQCERYGRLYTWSAAHEVCRSLGSGWRLPSMEDWKTLAVHYGGLFGDGSGNGKSAYQALLVGGQSGLEMLLGGGRQADGYARLEAHGFYWSTTEESPTSARLLNFGKGSGAVYDQNGGEKTSAYSVRCVSDVQKVKAPKYPSIEAVSHEEAGLRFVFSASDATSTDPVVISVAGRDFKVEDGEHRVSLQKYWVSQQFKNDYRVVERYSASCDLKRPNEISGCDVYVVQDELSKQEFTFFVYMGNWPHLYK